MREIGIRVYRYVNYRLATADAITISSPTQSCSKNIIIYPDRCYTFTQSKTHLFHTQHAKHPQTTLARIGYLPPGGQQVTLKGADNVKSHAAYFTNLTYIETNTYHISKDKMHTMTARTLHVTNNREATRWK